MKKIWIGAILVIFSIEPLRASLERKIGDPSGERKSAFALLQAAGVSGDCLQQFEELQEELQRKEQHHKGIGLDVWGNLVDQARDKREEQAMKNQLGNTFK